MLTSTGSRGKRDIMRVASEKTKIARNEGTGDRRVEIHVRKRPKTSGRRAHAALATSGAGGQNYKLSERADASASIGSPASTRLRDARAWLGAHLHPSPRSRPPSRRRVARADAKISLGFSIGLTQWAGE